MIAAEHADTLARAALEAEGWQVRTTVPNVVVAEKPDERRGTRHVYGSSEKEILDHVASGREFRPRKERADTTQEERSQ